MMMMMLASLIRENVDHRSIPDDDLFEKCKFRADTARARWT